jgi:hypothetical protein
MTHKCNKISWRYEKGICISTEFKVVLAKAIVFTGAIQIAASIQNNEVELRYELDHSNPAGPLVLWESSDRQEHLNTVKFLSVQTPVLNKKAGFIRMNQIRNEGYCKSFNLSYILIQLIQQPAFQLSFYFKFLQFVPLFHASVQ